MPLIVFTAPIERDRSIREQYRGPGRAYRKLRWYYQIVHHDIWDYDISAPPALIDVRRNGKTIPALAETNKMGLLFILDRTTGKPIYRCRRASGAERRDSRRVVFADRAVSSQAASVVADDDDQG